ncbi:MAG: hypothetical protein ACRC3B_01995 [Bacteroidia bacterium]
MVVVGFIAEGSTDKLVLESDNFRGLLTNWGIKYVPEVINARGCGNQLPKHRESYSAFLRDKGATHIIILADQDNAPCYTRRKEMIQPGEDEYVIISRRMLESWFLADSKALNRFLNAGDFFWEAPELTETPLEEINRLSLHHRKRGVNDKLILTKQMLKSGFSIWAASMHPNCPSAAYFVQKLQSLS